MMARRNLSIFLVTVLTFACSSSGEDGSGSNGSGGQAGTGAGGSSGTGDLGSAGAGTGTGDRPGNNLRPGDECVGELVRGELLPTDMYVMMDKSVSMGDSQDIYLIPGGGTKWDAVQEGFQAFVDLPQVAGMGMGIDFFGQDDGDARCDPATYSTPEVEIADLPGIGGDILGSFDNFSPGGNTPLTPALRGAIQHAADWRRDHPERQVIVVLVTDGKPNGCNSSAENLAQAAQDGLEGDPSVKTFVLGIMGQELSPDEFATDMRAVAEAGGSDAVLIDATSDLAQEFADALERIRGTAFLPCRYSIPVPESGETIDPNRVNVTFTPESGDSKAIFKVDGESACAGDEGWYYDDPTAPGAIELCPASCDEAGARMDSRIEILLGCVSEIR